MIFNRKKREIRKALTSHLDRRIDKPRPRRRRRDNDQIRHMTQREIDRYDR